MHMFTLASRVRGLTFSCHWSIALHAASPSTDLRAVNLEIPRTRDELVDSNDLYDFLSINNICERNMG